jgi:hypothetical protein
MHCRTNRRWLGVFVMIVFASTCCTFTMAAPLTFRFEATVEDILVGNPYESGVAFHQGDIVTGEFTFQPNQGNGDTRFTVVQPYRFLLDINGDKLFAPTFEITADDDDFIFDFDEATVVDQLELRGAYLQPLNPSSGVNIAPSQSSFRVELWAGVFLPQQVVEVLEPANIPADVGVWNELDIRRNLHVILRNGEGGVVSFSATIGPISQVPEPAWTSCTLLAAITASTFRGPLRIRQLGTR